MQTFAVNLQPGKLTMSTPQNMFSTIPSEELTTATGGVTSSGQIQKRDLWQLKHALSDVTSSQQNNQSSQQGLMMGMVMALAMRNRG
jgi:hypothetical protein